MRILIFHTDETEPDEDPWHDATLEPPDEWQTQAVDGNIETWLCVLEEEWSNRPHDNDLDFADYLVEHHGFTKHNDSDDVHFYVRSN